MSDKSCPHCRPAIIFEAVQSETLIAPWNKKHETNGSIVCWNSDECVGVNAGGTEGVGLLTVGIGGSRLTQFWQNTTWTLINNIVEVSKEYVDLCF
jgi:hypothetical protein